MIKKMLFVILFFALSINLLAQDYINLEIEIIDESQNLSKSSAFGEKLVEYNNHRFFDVISLITEISPENFSLKGNAKNPLIKLKATSIDKIEREDLIKELIKKLKKDFKINIKFNKVKKKVKILYSTNERKLEKCSKEETQSSMVKINRTFKAKCVSLKELVKQINDWYGLRLHSGFKEEDKYNFSIHHANDFEELATELKFFYSLEIREEKRFINTLLIEYDI